MALQPAPIAAAILIAALSACASSSSEPRDGALSAEADSLGATQRIESCVDRLLSRANVLGASSTAVRRYGRNTYCARFERRNWIYDDGALSIKAHKWLQAGRTCVVGREGDKTRTVPCEEVGPRGLECALLHHVRRSEVRKYVERLQGEGDVECDDETPLHELGVP